MNHTIKWWVGVALAILPLCSMFLWSNAVRPCDDSQYGHTYSTYMDQLDVMIFVIFSFTEENFSYDKKIFYSFLLFFVPLIGFLQTVQWIEYVAAH